MLIRQHVKDANEDWKNIVLGLHYGGVPSVNSLHSIYNFLDKPWVVRQFILTHLEQSCLLSYRFCWKLFLYKLEWKDSYKLLKKHFEIFEFFFIDNDYL